MVKKMGALCLVFLMIFMFVDPMFAINESLTDEELTQAYIDFSVRMARKNMSVCVCLENFIDGYTGELSIEEYIDEMLDYETKLFLERRDTVKENGVVKDSITSRSGSGRWYDNIGTTTIKLEGAPSYSKYNIENIVHIGDVIYETDGGWASLVGHIALVVGTYYDADHYTLYTRTIEANLDGIVYGVLDDTRYEERGVKVYKVANSTSLHRAEAVRFCIAQLGETYSLKLVGNCSCSDSEDEWYCSELVWAAYYNQDINFYGTDIPKNPYRPAMLASSLELTEKTIIED